MNRERIDELTAQWLAGDLDDAGRRDLAEAARSDPDIAAQLSSLAVVDRLMGIALDERGEQVFVANVLQRVQAESSRQFTADVMEKVNREPPPDIPIKAPMRERKLDEEPESAPVAEPGKIVVKRSDFERHHARVKQKPGILRYVLVPLAAAAMLFLAVKTGRLGLPAPKPIRVAAADGESALRVERDGAWVPLREGAGLESGARIKTDGDAAVLAFRDESRIELGGNTEIKVFTASESEGKRIVMIGGRVSLDVAPQPEERPLRIETAQARVTVVGTKLNVLDSETQSRVEVTEGQVEAMRLSDGKTVTLSEGEAAAVSEYLPLIVQKISDPRASIRALIDAGRAVMIDDFQTADLRKGQKMIRGQNENSTLNSGIRPDHGPHRALMGDYTIVSGEGAWIGVFDINRADWSDYDGVAFLIRQSSEDRHDITFSVGRQEKYPDSDDRVNYGKMLGDLNDSWQLAMLSWEDFKERGRGAPLKENLEFLRDVNSFFITVIGEGAGSMAIDDVCLIKKD